MAEVIPKHFGGLSTNPCLDNHLYFDSFSGDKVLVFSQSLLSLDLIEKFLSIAAYDDTYGTWNHGKDYFRMDGSTGPDVRKKWCSYFNHEKNTDMRLFLISTKAGGLGINLVAANRVIIFDASWNPAHDVQSIFRVYRFGQEKPVYIYRLDFWLPDVVRGSFRNRFSSPGPLPILKSESRFSVLKVAPSALLTIIEHC